MFFSLIYVCQYNYVIINGSNINSSIQDTDEATEEAWRNLDLRQQLLMRPASAVDATAAAQHVPLQCCGVNVTTVSSTGVELSSRADQFNANGHATGRSDIGPFLLG
jgi:hypothetical protein